MMGAHLPRILFVAPSSNVHTQKWCNWFVSRGYEVHVATFDGEEIGNVFVHHITTPANPSSSDAGKIAYLLGIDKLRQIEEEVSPDIVHVHYASSYGAVASVAIRRPYYLSLWGSDVYEFPRKSLIHRLFLKRSLNKASWLMSTSNAMAKEASRYTTKPFLITPFGVDTRSFCPVGKQVAKQYFTVGTVKGLSRTYGIDLLLKGCALAIKAVPEIPLRVKIAGVGPDEAELRSLAYDLGLEDRVEWLGFVHPDLVPSVWQSMDLAVIPSRCESFGVSAVEAQSCGIPVLVSDADGLLEATTPLSRKVVPREDPNAIALAMVELFKNPAQRQKMGAAGREFVSSAYSLETCFAKIEHAYEEAL